MFNFLVVAPPFLLVNVVPGGIHCCIALFSCWRLPEWAFLLLLLLLLLEAAREDHGLKKFTPKYMSISLRLLLLLKTLIMMVLLPITWCRRRQQGREVTPAGGGDISKVKRREFKEQSGIQGAVGTRTIQPSIIMSQGMMDWRHLLCVRGVRWCMCPGQCCWVPAGNGCCWWEDVRDEWQSSNLYSTWAKLIGGHLLQILFWHELRKKISGQLGSGGGNFWKLPEAKFEVNDPFLGYGYYLNFEK